MAADAESSQEYAERPKEGELWQQMIERQQRESSNRGGYLRELLRSLPDDQQQDRERGGDRTLLFDSGQLMAEASYQDLLRAASQRVVPQQDRELER